MAASARDVARRVLARVHQGAYATLTLSGELGRFRLSGADRALCRELVYGVLRQRLRLDRALAACTHRGPSSLDGLDAATRDALRLGAYQILFLRVADHAAVDDAVEAVKRRRGTRLAGFANALLRQLARTGEPPLPESCDVASLSLRFSMPQWIVADALHRFPLAEAQAFLEAQNAPPPLWLRLNLLRGSREAALRALACEIGAERVHPSERLPEAVRARGQELFAGTAYGEGWYTAQDLGAQLVAHLLLAATSPEQAPLPRGPILDACAGVGGKSTHLAALARDQRDIDAADILEHKLSLCVDHAHRLGCRRIHPLPVDLTRDDAPLRPTYAAILLDAPCSGLGVLRRHPETRWRPTPPVAKLAALQRQLLQALAPRLAPGGHLVYSVCTYTEEEGPAQIAGFLKENPQFFIAPPDPAAPPFTGLLDAQGGLHTWPHRDDADSFYAVRLRRMV